MNEDDTDFEAAAADVLRLPVGAPGRGSRAADLVRRLILRPLGAPVHLFRHLDHLLEAAEQSPPMSALLPRHRMAAQGMALMYQIAEGPSAGLEAIEIKLKALTAQTSGEPGLAPLMQSAQMALTMRQATEQGNESALHRLPEMVAELSASMPEDPAASKISEILAHGMEGLAANQRGDSASAWRHFGLMQDAVGALSPDDPLRAVMSQTAGPGAAIRSLLGDDGTPRPGRLTEEEMVTVTALTGQPGADPTLGRLAAGAAILMSDETDLVRIDQGIEQFRQALAETPSTSRQRPFCLTSVALGLLRRSEVTGTTRGLDEATDLLEQARELLGGPQHPQWSYTNDLLSTIRQRRGDYHGVRESAMTAQRGYTWRVLLEADPAGAQISIKDAAQAAVDNARRCISVDDPAGALRALDAGRGLMLFAATELHRIPARLSAAGRPELARQWSLGRTPSDQLRRQVLEILAKDSADNLFDPPTLPAVQSALALLEADALVYLMPAEPPLGGMALMAPATGPPAYMVLPHLILGKDTDVGRYIAALPTREANSPRRDLVPEDVTDFADRVEALCDWAWRAAIGPLLESYLPRLPERADGRVRRIVLIPMGDLARVPWHAARRKDGVYAVQLAAISQAVSARLLCDNALLAPVPLGSTGLVVGDPDTGGRAIPLSSARLEAHAVRRVFYRGARYVGRLPDGRLSASGAGTAKEVRDWLANLSPSAGAMLHLACHGSYAPGRDASALLLLADTADLTTDATGTAAPDDFTDTGKTGVRPTAGIGDATVTLGATGVRAGADPERRSSELSAAELVNLLAEVPGRGIALVVLAACNSGRSIYGYDEAYSLGTGFLAGEVRSVLSTQWSVPDAATSSLMFLFHHYLRHDGLPPWQALRQAQMWMLDPDREVPPQMPPELIPGPGDDPAGVLNWAGFVHYGQ